MESLVHAPVVHSLSTSRFDPAMTSPSSFYPRAGQFISYQLHDLNRQWHLSSSFFSFCTRWNSQTPVILDFWIPYFEFLKFSSSSLNHDWIHLPTRRNSQTPVILEFLSSVHIYLNFEIRMDILLYILWIFFKFSHLLSTTIKIHIYILWIFAVPFIFSQPRLNSNF